VPRPVRLNSIFGRVRDFLRAARYFFQIDAFNVMRGSPGRDARRTLAIFEVGRERRNASGQHLRGQVRCGRDRMRNPIEETYRHIRYRGALVSIAATANLASNGTAFEFIARVMA
jgi:hypothetical protein